MYTIHFFDEFVFDDVVLFEGTLDECLDFVAEDEDGELYITEPDGFTVYES